MRCLPQVVTMSSASENLYTSKCVKLDVLIVVIMKITILQDGTSCSLVYGYGTYLY